MHAGYYDYKCQKCAKHGINGYGNVMHVNKMHESVLYYKCKKCGIH